MSQSDYIRLQRISQELSDISHNLAPVISSEKYTEYMAYTLAYNIPNYKTVYSVELQSDKQEIFDMEIPCYMKCNQFYLCTGTNQRANRVLDGSGYGFFVPPVYPKRKTKDLFRLSVPGYMGHLKSLNYIKENLCNPKTGKYMCNPAPAQKNSSYAGYIDRKKALTYAKLNKKGHV